MRKFLLANILFICGCSEQNDFINNDEKNETNMDGVVMTIPEFIVSETDASTRTLLIPTESGIGFSWKDGDNVGIYTESTAMASFIVDQINQNARSATFDGGGFYLKQGSTYYAFSPYDAASTDKTLVSVDYTGQTQIANNDCSHLASYDYMAANAVASGPNNATFNFSHLGAIAKFNIKVPQDGNFIRLTITSTSDFLTHGTIDLTAENPSIIATQSANEIILDLDNVASTGRILTAYLMLPPTNLFGERVTCTLTDDTGISYIGYVFGKNMEASNVYTYSLSVSDDPTPYLTFTATGLQTLTMSKAVETLEYSVDNGAWAELGTEEVVFGDSNGDLKLRGKSATGTVVGSLGSNIVFSNNTEVFCYGDIRTLVDYENYSMADCRNASFKWLFKNCTALVTAPELPSTVLAESCYAGMFYGCSSLKKAPALPAMSLSQGCYSQMFEGCISITDTPELRAKELVQNCYRYMFQNCTSLNHVVIYAETLDGTWGYCDYMLNGVASSGILEKSMFMDFEYNFNLGLDWILKYVEQPKQIQQYVDLGIQDENGNTVYWAKCNLGAKYEYSFGDSFCWAEIDPKLICSYENYKYGWSRDWNDYPHQMKDCLKKYCTSSNYGRKDDYVQLLEIDDAARANWGGRWRTPTPFELSQLIEKCDWTFVSSGSNNGYGGVSGYIVSNPETPSHYIFLPLCGYRIYNYYRVDEGRNAIYLSNSIDVSYPINNKYLIIFDGGKRISGEIRYQGMSIRPVFTDN